MCHPRFVHNPAEYIRLTKTEEVASEPPVMLASMVTMIASRCTKTVATSNTADVKALIGRQWSRWCRRRRHSPWRFGGGCCWIGCSAVNWHSSFRSIVVRCFTDSGCHFNRSVQSSGQFAQERDDQRNQLRYCKRSKLCSSVHATTTQEHQDRNTIQLSTSSNQRSNPRLHKNCPWQDQDGTRPPKPLNQDGHTKIE